jgi:hypothetical protein
MLSPILECLVLTLISIANCLSNPQKNYNGQDPYEFNFQRYINLGKRSKEKYKGISDDTGNSGVCWLAII